MTMSKVKEILHAQLDDRAENKTIQVRGKRQMKKTASSLVCEKEKQWYRSFYMNVRNQKI